MLAEEVAGENPLDRIHLLASDPVTAYFMRAERAGRRAMPVYCVWLPTSATASGPLAAKPTSSYAPKWRPGILLRRTREMDNRRFAPDTCGVVDPGFYVALDFVGGPAGEIERIVNSSRPGDAIGGAGEWMVLFRPGGPVSPDEAEALRIVPRVGVMDPKIDERP
jgi:hypothetical protein